VAGIGVQEGDVLGMVVGVADDHGEDHLLEQPQEFYL